ncbi:hypothetical protein NUSPORA_01197 [Nucleospora cyclopteri]
MCAKKSKKVIKKVKKEEIKYNEEEVKKNEEEVKKNEEEVKKNEEEIKNNEEEIKNNEEEEQIKGETTIINEEFLSKIKKQIEFYFSDANYTKDKFLLETAIKNNGSVPIITLLTFKRLKALDSTAELVKKACENSTVVKVVDEALQKIETEEFKEYKKNRNVEKRTVAIAGFDKSMNLDQIEEFLKQKYDPLRILMRRNGKKEFNGICLVEFKTEEEVKSILEDELNLEVENITEKEDSIEETVKRQKTKEIKLKVMTKEDFLEMVNKDKEDSQVKKIKQDFIPKLYKVIAKNDEQMTVQGIKTEFDAIAFVDLSKNVCRLKYREEWEEKEFETFTLKKLPLEEATKYVNGLNIKPKSEKKNKK